MFVILPLKKILLESKAKAHTDSIIILNWLSFLDKQFSAAFFSQLIIHFCCCITFMWSSLSNLFCFDFVLFCLNHFCSLHFCSNFLCFPSTVRLIDRWHLHNFSFLFCLSSSLFSLHFSIVLHPFPHLDSGSVRERFTQLVFILIGYAYPSPLSDTFLDLMSLIKYD